jgi:phosphoglycolate phosphatase-like HAD superfamily hydrolase
LQDLRFRGETRSVTRKLVLFDIDGTILLSAGAGRRSILAAIGGTVAEPDKLPPIRFDGKTDPQIVIELLTAAGHPEPDDPERILLVLERYVKHLEEDLATNGHRSRVMPGIPSLLNELEQEPGVLLGLLTGNVAPGARLKLRAAGLDPDRFRVGAYGSDHAERPCLPPIAVERAEPLAGRKLWGKEVVIIGDTPADVACAASIGARTIGVATGGFTVEELEAAGADLVFADLSDTGRAVEAILS